MSFSFLQTVPQDIAHAISGLDFSLDGEAKQHSVNLLLEKTVLVGGKRLRPLLTMLMGRLFDISLDRLSPYARLIELLHAASLAHDDVIDNATMRRGVESINIVAANKKAVLAGDFLFAEVIVAVSEQGNLQLVREVAKVIQSLSAGEWLQLKLAQERKVDMDLVQEVACHKTASVLSWCSIVGACLSDLDASSELYVLAEKFGENLGLAFQYVDDTLDFDPLGQKDFMLDEENGVINAVMVHWLEANVSERKSFLQGKQCHPDIFDPAFKKSIDQVRALAFDHLKQARVALDNIVKKLDLPLDHSELYAKPLYSLLDFLADRKF